ncbi:MAG: FKBP-type peptidyl-prolyl cis-trans isomerase [Pseudomonadota bacterium]|nr:FKBP-type peptidyl-prolyl cis-trans isomerase [Pseudomonadota bacterium]
MKLVLSEPQVPETAMDKIAQNTAVTIRYTMKTEAARGEFKERPEEEVRFIFGVDPQVPTLEKALEGSTAGQKFSLQIPPSEIYGEHDPSLIREIPKKGLIKKRIREGEFYRQMKMGSLVSFKVLEIREDTVRVDFNRPMAGISASIDVEVVAIRPASEAEIAAARENQRKKSIGCG